MAMTQTNPCFTCKCEVWVPDALWESCKRSRGPGGISYYCAFGHQQHLIEGESDETKLRRERDPDARRGANLHHDGRKEHRKVLVGPLVAADRRLRPVRRRA